MKAIVGGGGFLFRFMISGITAILVVSTLSLAINFFAGGAGASGVTGKVVQPEPGSAVLYILLEAIVGALTFVGSFKVVSRKK
jgi:hypothetical protein